ncbi:hypothetical protein [Deinococcus humi]|uniref:Uncharacterized protein n=1 Tax=Deinococcus humi TaxID=662880 RepID=A0A7W8JRY0_9DEIO|nr:hypothetical protein [Deinococcus humi]MBB5362092.1 hypothetical protein [Deinococcus humi]GGO22110.1 hypothetical protein GCM10008949_09040 [Deinococcus humi]
MSNMLNEILGDLRGEIVGLVFGLLLTGGLWLLRKGKSWVSLQRTRQSDSNTEVAQRIASDTQRMLAFVGTILCVVLSSISLALGILSLWATFSGLIPSWTSVVGGLLLGAAYVGIDALFLLMKAAKEVAARERARLSAMN